MTKPDDKPQSAKDKAKAEKAERLAQALRDNLKRRKTQAQSRKASGESGES